MTNHPCSGQYQIDQAQRREEEWAEQADEEESIAELMAKIKRKADEILENTDAT